MKSQMYVPGGYIRKNRIWKSISISWQFPKNRKFQEIMEIPRKFLVTTTNFLEGFEIVHLFSWFSNTISVCFISLCYLEVCMSMPKMQDYVNLWIFQHRNSLFFLPTTLSFLPLTIHCKGPSLDGWSPSSWQFSSLPQPVCLLLASTNGLLPLNKQPPLLANGLPSWQTSGKQSCAVVWPYLHSLCRLCRST